MSTQPTIDLSALPAPNVVDSLDFDTIKSAMIADLQARDPLFTALVESDPAYKIIEVCAYRELLLRQRVNDSARAVMLALATSGDLDQLGALFGVSRLILDAGDPTANPPVPPTYESDTNFRARIQLSPEAVTTAGPSGAYEYWSKTVPIVKDVAVSSPTPGAVLVTILTTRASGGAAITADINAVTAVLDADDVRPLTDQVTVQSATITNYSVTATIYTLSGPDPTVVMAAALAAAQAYTTAQNRIGATVAVSGLLAALHQPGVAKVEMSVPSSDVSVDAVHASYCTAINLTNGGVST